MDNLCIDLGTLLDNPSVKTLENPGVHSMHCLLDVPSCVRSMFTVLRDPTNAGGKYSVAYQLGLNGTQLMVEAATKVIDNLFEIYV